MPGLDDYIQIVEDGNEKVASASHKVTPSLLDKLAAELGAYEGTEQSAAGTGDSKVVSADAASSVAGAAPGAADAQSSVLSAASSIAGANPAVVAATDVVAVPQEVAAGASPEEKPAGEVAAPVKPNEGVVISAADGVVGDVNLFSKEPAAVAMAVEKTASDIENGKAIGRAMAQSFNAELQKIATDNEFEEAKDILKEAGLLNDYKLV